MTNHLDLSWDLSFIKHAQPGEPATVFISHPDSTTVFHRSLGMYEWVQSAGTLGPMLEPFSYKTKHEPGLRSPSVNIFQDSFTSQGHQKGKLLPTSHAQNQRSSECVWKSSTPGIWLHSRWSTDTSENTGNRRNFHPRVYKNLRKLKWQIKQSLREIFFSSVLSLYCIILLNLNRLYVGLLQCFVVSHVSFDSYKTVHCIMCNMQDFLHY